MFLPYTADVLGSIIDFGLGMSKFGEYGLLLSDNVVHYDFGDLNFHLGSIFPIAANCSSDGKPLTRKRGG